MSTLRPPDVGRKARSSRPADLPKEARSPPHAEFEARLARDGFEHVAGMDEAGRGPLAGPVTAAAVILDPMATPAGLDDSKLLSAPAREALFGAILESAISVGIGFASVAEIDRVNIRQATFLAMRRALRGLARPAAYVIVDGNDHPPDLPCPGHALVKGDAISVSIAAASIVAKVVRDRLMTRADADHPHYGFALHKGYATAAHRAAIARHGPSALHRLTFASAGLGARDDPEFHAGAEED